MRGPVMASIQGVVAALGLAGAAIAMEFPAKPVQIILPFGAGPGDSLARIVAGCVAPRWKQPVIVVNRPGASGALAANLVKSAPPDGHVLMLGASTSVTDLVTTRSPAYDIRADFQPITKVVFGIQGIYVNANVPARTIPEFLAYAKANPGKLNYGTVGVGSVNHVSTEALSTTLGIEMVHVPYAQGAGASYAALMAGEIQFTTTDVTGAQAAVDTGKVRILGVIAKERMQSRPDVPAIVEFYPAMAAYTGTLWYGFFAPPKVPAALLQRLHADVVACLDEAPVRAAIRKYGYEENQIVGNTPEQFRASIAEDVVRLRDIVERAKIPLR